MPPRRRPRSWLAGRLRSVAGAVQRLAERVDDPAAAPERPVDPPRRLGEPPQHWVDLVAAHAPGLLRELDLDQVAPTQDQTPPGPVSPRRPVGPAGHALRPAADLGRVGELGTARTDRLAAAAQGRSGDPHRPTRPGGDGDRARHGAEGSGPGDPHGRSDQRVPVIRPATPIGSEPAGGRYGLESAGGRDGSASGGTRFAAQAGAHLRETTSTPGPAGEILPRSTAEPSATSLGRPDRSMGGPSQPALPDEADRRVRIGEHPTEAHPPPDDARRAERLTGQLPGRSPEHHFPERHASWLAEQQRSGRYRGPAVTAPRHDPYTARRHDQQSRPDRDQHAVVRHGQRGREIGQWDGPPGYGTGVAEVDGGGRWPASAVFGSTAVGPDVDPWPALPDDGPLWTVSGAALDAGHERRLDREQAGG
ncbi:hypothetical protein [Micromonospora sp. WMMD736]|uniref:hypothetical protein n=1 Tax=Micromonospora sp. WMMD736 TaxID=3404112 RepID=UPI003B95E51E